MYIFIQEINYNANFLLKGSRTGNYLILKKSFKLTVPGLSIFSYLTINWKHEISVHEQ